MDAASLNKKKVAELRDDLAELGLPTSGKKADLVDRLLEYYASVEGSPGGSAGARPESSPGNDGEEEGDEGDEEEEEEEEEEDEGGEDEEEEDVPAKAPETTSKATDGTNKAKPAPVNVLGSSSVAKVKELSMEERILARAARFGTESKAVAEVKKAQRAERFGLPLSGSSSSPGQKGGAGGGKYRNIGGPIAVDEEELKRREARAKKFGIVTKEASQSIEQLKKRKRAERFGSVEQGNQLADTEEEAKRARRAERFQ